MKNQKWTESEAKSTRFREHTLTLGPSYSVESSFYHNSAFAERQNESQLLVRAYSARQSNSCGSLGFRMSH